MSTDIPKNLLVSRLSEALRDFGLEPSVETGASNGVELFIRVLVGRDDVAVVMESHDRKEGRKRAEQATMLLLKRNDVKCAVAVCYAGRDSHESTEHPRYTWRVVHKPGQDSDWMTGGLAGLALTVMLSPAGLTKPGDAARALVNNLVEYNAGALVRIIPMAAATNETFVETRRLLVRAYHLDFIMAYHDGKRAGFSWTGNKREVLLVCRPRSSARDSMSATQAINLAKSPSTAEGVRAIATCIKQDIESGDESVDEFGSVRRVDYAELHDGDWGALHFLSPFLREQFLQLKRGGMFRSVHLGAIADIGPTGRSVRDAFSKRQLAPDAQGYKAFWGHGSASVQTMRAKAVSNIWAHPERLKSARRHWNRRSRLLLPLQPHLPKARLMAVRHDQLMLGSMWTNCRIRIPEDEQADHEKALCVYLNSTLGILSMLGGSTRRNDFNRLWPTVEDMKRLPVPDFSQKAGALPALAAAFDESGDRNMSPLRQLDTCPVQNAIDAAVCDAMGISDELIRAIGQHLVAEPSVAGGTGERQALPKVVGQQQLFDLLIRDNNFCRSRH